MSIHRVALIFDDRIRPDTTGVYVRKALAELVEVVHFQPGQSDAIPASGFDLHLSIDDDTEHRLPASLHPRAYWAIDTHRDFPVRFERSVPCDLVFAAQRDGTERLRSAGIDSANWLPLACDPDIHRRHEVPKAYDVAFVGHSGPGPRDDLLERIRRDFPEHFIGTAFFEEMARIYSASRVVFNRSLRNDVNMRVFEALACGSLLITNDLADNGQDELFRDGVHLATYREPSEMRERIGYYLEHEDRREAIAAAGRAEAIARHTYRHRMEWLLAEVERRLGRTVVAGGTRQGLHLDGNAGKIPPEGGTPARDGASPGWSPAFRRSDDSQKLPPEGGTPAGDGALPGWSSAFRRSGDLEKIPPEGGTPAGTGPSPGWSSAFRRSDDPEPIPPEGGTPAGDGASPGWSPAFRRSPDPTSIAALATIIVPCFNQCAFTRLCLQALFRHTGPAWELIVIDNGSTDDTAAYLSGVQDATAVPVTVITNARNVGFPAAINQGLQAASGEYLVLLNNDAVVTDLWLDQLIALTRAPVDLSMENAANTEMKTEGNGATRGDADRETFGRAEGGVGRPAPNAAPCRTEPPSLPTPHSPLPTRRIGLVGPVSNYVSPPQLVEHVPYRDLDEMHVFAKSWRAEHRGKWFTVPKLSGFCLLMTRAVHDAVGGLDERFGLGLFDDDDLAERARRAGFELAVAHDLFVHHFGSRTFAGNGIDAEALLEVNERRFADKWGHAMPRGRRVALRPWAGSEPPPMLANPIRQEIGPQMDADGRRWELQIADGELQIPEKLRLEKAPDIVAPPRTSRPIISSSHLRPSASICGQDSSVRRAGSPSVTLTMVVRDEEKNLSNCLQSVEGIFDEIVIVDTGSLDRTREIAREFGARVFDFAWVDDFAAARNEALAHATGDYAFWLDADDVVDPPQRETLRALLDGLRPGEPAGYVVRCACDPSPDGSGGETVVDHVRLFPLRENIRWTYRVHEQIMPALRRAGIPVCWTDLVVRHTGYVDLALRGRKLDRDARILQEELKDRPYDPFVLFNLGAIANERRDWSGALTYLRRSLSGSAPSDSITRKLFALIARAHQMMGETAEALRTCAEGLSLDAQDAELLFRKAVIHRQRGESAEVEQSWRRILGLRRPEQFASLDMGIYGHLTRRNLAVLAVERGDPAEAERLWRSVLAECPDDREALAMLARLQTRVKTPVPAGR